jgi:hypothetical protein
MIIAEMDRTSATFMPQQCTAQVRTADLRRKIGDRCRKPASCYVDDAPMCSRHAADAAYRYLARDPVML